MSKSDEEEAEPEEGAKKQKVRTLMLAATLRSKKGPEVLAALQDLHTRLEARGFKVGRVHSDRGSEFLTLSFKRWCSSKSIGRTTTVGDDAKGNGRAEAAIGLYKRRGRTHLMSAGLPENDWPFAIRWENELRWTQFVGEPHPSTSIHKNVHFGSKIMIRMKNWDHKNAFAPRAQEGIFFGVSYNLSKQGCVVKLQNGEVQNATTIWPLPEQLDWQGSGTLAGWSMNKDPDDKIFYMHVSGERRWTMPLSVVLDSETQAEGGWTLLVISSRFLRWFLKQRGSPKTEAKQQRPSRRRSRQR